MVLGEVDAPLAEYLRDSPLTALDTIWDAYSSVATAGEGEAGNLGTAILDQCDTVEVPECVLRHAEVPSKDSIEERLCKRIKTQDVMKLGKDCLNELLVRTLQNLLIVRTSDEAAQKHLALRCAARPLGGGVSSRHQRTVLYEGTQDPERIQIETNLVLVEGDRDGRRG